MAIEVQFSSKPGAPGDMRVVGIKGEGNTFPYAEYFQWVVNDTVPPSADLSLLTQAELIREKRQKRQFLYWLAPGLDHAEAAAESGLPIEDIPGRVADWQARRDALEAAGFYSTNYNVKELYKLGVAVVDSTVKQVREWLEPLLDEAAHDAVHNAEVADRAFRINYHALDGLSAPFQAIYDSLINQNEWTPPFGHPTQDRPWTAAEIISNVPLP
ncbi:MAG TPA: hypothetical protein VM487_17500 [Phycisphaerae bacterium]|nr:hypothetical protein [Phycisphaerae bacterium]